MTFAEWKKRSKTYKAFGAMSDKFFPASLSRCCQAAYKSGERQGRKDAEEMEKRRRTLNRLVARRSLGSWR